VEWRQQIDEQWAEKPVELKDIDIPGVEELLANGDGNLLLVNLWATWCGPCIIEFPRLIELQRMYGQRHFEVVTISMDRPNMGPSVLEFLDGKEAAVVNYLFDGEDREPFFELVDPGWQGNIPYTMIIKPGGEVIYRHDGIIDPLEVKKVIIGQLGRYFADD
jgi:thiol-disulfide isomerase/thioredoxin